MPPELPGNDRALLIRIDERTQQIQKQMGTYVTKAEFEPVKRVVYGTVGIILTSVVLALLILIIGGGP